MRGRVARGRRFTSGVRASTSALAVALLLAAPRLAFAHAVPVAMVPEANAVVGESPREITIRFSERVEPRASSLQVVQHARAAGRHRSSARRPG